MNIMNVSPRVARNLWTILAATTVLAGLSTAPAQAGTDVIYPGEQCVLNPISAGQHTTSFYGSIGNPSASSNLFVDCPIPHDVNIAGISSGVVAVINQIGGGGFIERAACTLRSVNIPSDGVVTGWWDTQYSATTSPNTQYLLFGSLPASDHMFYNCIIPATYNGKTSYINAYRMTEY